MSRKLRVFLCHASQDKPAVRELYKKLAAEKWIEPWLDEEELYPGQDWNMEIEKAVEAADAIIVCLSKGSITKEGYVQREIRTALDYADYKPEGTLYVIPIRLEECEPPRRLRAWQYADYFPITQREYAYKRLLVSLKKRAESLGIQLQTTETFASPQELESQAIQFELSGKPLDALKVYYQIKKIDPRFPRVNVKISQLEKETRPKPSRITPTPSTSISEPVKQKKPTPKFNFRLLGIGGIVLFSVILGAYAINYLAHLPTTPKPSPTAPFVFTPYPAFSTSTAVFVFTPYSVFSTPTPVPEIGSTMISPKDGMKLLYVPAGNFLMGSVDSDPNAQPDEKPQHTVYLDAFWIDQTDVTNAMYAKCVSASVCKQPANLTSKTHSSYFDNPQFGNYPVIYVDWNMANAYCKWAGRQLPTEAQWEKAARGTDGRIYPWGNNRPDFDVTLSNYNLRVGDTTAVGDYPNGASPYGALDMAGNVLQWVADWYNDTYYQNQSLLLSNPSGPTLGQYRVMRGGWFNFSGDIHSAVRARTVPFNSFYNIGFRCVSGMQ